MGALATAVAEIAAPPTPSLHCSTRAWDHKGGTQTPCRRHCGRSWSGPRTLQVPSCGKCRHPDAQPAQALLAATKQMRKSLDDLDVLPVLNHRQKYDLVSDSHKDNFSKIKDYWEIIRIIG